MKIEAEIGMMTLQAKEYQRLPATIRSQEEVRKDCTLEFLETLQTPWFGTSSFHNYERVNFCCFKPSSL